MSHASETQAQGDRVGKSSGHLGSPPHWPPGQSTLTQLLGMVTQESHLLSKAGEGIRMGRM